jgi:hypothetical protein
MQGSLAGIAPAPLTPLFALFYSGHACHSEWEACVPKEVKNMAAVCVACMRRKLHRFGTVGGVECPGLHSE